MDGLEAVEGIGDPFRQDLWRLSRFTLQSLRPGLQLEEKEKGLWDEEQPLPGE